MSRDEIHHSIADADDIEEVSDEISVGDVFRSIVGHPLQLVTRWNWKAASLAVLIRGSVYLVVYFVRKESTDVIVTAVVFESVSRFLSTGLAGALLQSFRKAQPMWLANLICSVMLPAFSHTIEFLTHYTQETYLSDTFAASQNNSRRITFPFSVLLSVVSVLFTLYANRNGTLLVGAGKETQTFATDMKQVPRLIANFVAALPTEICYFLEQKKLLNALLTILCFGVAVGGILGTTRWKLNWAVQATVIGWVFIAVITVLTYIIRRIRGDNFFTKYPEGR
jgi:hypothetical protein